LVQLRAALTLRSVLSELVRDIRFDNMKQDTLDLNVIRIELALRREIIDGT
jgi:hypothetical protein